MNRIAFCQAAVLLVASFASIGHAADSVAPPLKVGIAVTDVTPPIPFRMSGYFSERLSTGVKDPLRAKAIVLKQGDESAALVFVDVVSLPRDITGEARRQASALAGIPFDRIVVCATHSHTGPLIYGALSTFFHEQNIAHFGRDPYDPAEYRAALISQIAAAVGEANKNLKPVELRAGYAIENRLAFNRRFHMKDGSVRFNPGQKNPNIIRPAGPVDPQVGIVGMYRPGENMPEAALVSFALHLDTTSGTEYSADYPKVVEDVLRKQFGSKFTLLFGTGTCGDINHIDVTATGVRTAEEIGTMLGDTVLKAFDQNNLLQAEPAAFKAASTSAEAKLQSYSEGEQAQAQEDMKLIGGKELDFLSQVKAYKIIDLQRQTGDTVQLEIQAFRLTPETAIVTLPTEVFVEFGLAIKERSPFKTTLVIELANDSLGYIPTKKAFAEGSYETVNSRVTPGSGEQMVEAAVQLLKELD